MGRWGSTHLSHLIPTETQSKRSARNRQTQSKPLRAPCWLDGCITCNCKNGRSARTRAVPTVGSRPMAARAVRYWVCSISDKYMAMLLICREAAVLCRRGMHMPLEHPPSVPSVIRSVIRSVGRHFSYAPGGMKRGVCMKVGYSLVYASNEHAVQEPFFQSPQ